MKVQEILISKIESNPYQTRDNIELEPLKVLTKSIRERGLFSPITVLKNGHEFIVVSGHRRLAAFKRLRKKTIPAFVKDRKDDKALIVDLVHENLIREDLMPLEKANSIRLLLSQIPSTRDDPERMYTLINMLKNWKRRGYFPEHQKERTEGFDENDIFRVSSTLKSIGMSENMAVGYLMILRLPKHMAQEVVFNARGLKVRGKIVLKAAEQLARIKDVKYRDHLYQKAADGASVRIIQALCNLHIEKVEKGEWKGYTKRYHGCGKFKDDIKVMQSLQEDVGKVSRRIVSFKVDTLLKLEETLESEDFVSHMTGLKKELDLLLNRVNQKLEDKGYKEIKDPSKIPSFEVSVKKSIAKKNYRFTFPSSIAKKLDLSETEANFIKLKIDSIRT